MTKFSWIVWLAALPIALCGCEDLENKVAMEVFETMLELNGSEISIDEAFNELLPSGQTRTEVKAALIEKGFDVKSASTATLLEDCPDCDPTLLFATTRLDQASKCEELQMFYGYEVAVEIAFKDKKSAYVAGRLRKI